MTRTRNGSFHGTSPYDADVDAKMFGTRLKEIDQDLNMLFDIATGSNSPAFAPAVQTMTHDGTALSGSLLGIPVVNNPIDVRIAPVGAVSDQVIYLWAAPVFVASGESVYQIEVAARDDALDVTFETYDTSGALVRSLDSNFDADKQCWTASLIFPSSGVIYYVAVRCTYAGESFTFRGVRMWPARSFTADSSLPAPPIDAASMPVPTAPAATALAFETIHDEMFADNFSVAGWVVNTLNRNINAFWEWLTGAPVPGNPTVTNADTASTNPATSRFASKAQAGLANEPLVEFPLHAEGLGAILIDGSQTVNNADPPTTGMTQWFAPYAKVLHDNTVAVIHRARLMAPDFPTASNCTANVLCINASKGTPTNWQARVSAASAGASTWVNLSRLGSTLFYVASVTSVPFTPDALDTYSLEFRNNDGVAFTFEEASVLGWTIYFDP